MTTEIVYHTVSGSWRDIEDPDPGGTTNHPQYLVVSAMVTFYPRFPVGYAPIISNLDIGSSVYPDTALAIAPIQGRIVHGELETINTVDTPGVVLVSNFPALAARLLTDNVCNGELIYDVAFTNVVYSSSVQFLQNFAYVAPSDTTAVSLTSAGLTRLPYAGP